MRFFVPSADDLKQAEEIYHRIRDRIAAVGGPVIDKRIYRLKYRHDGLPETVVVGSDRHSFGVGSVMAIFEGSDGTHYVCTQSSSASDVEPHALPSSSVVEAEAFTALA
jgi:hypothetical protein